MSITSWNRFGNDDGIGYTVVENLKSSDKINKAQSSISIVHNNSNGAIFHEPKVFFGKSTIPQAISVLIKKSVTIII